MTIPISKDILTPSVRQRFWAKVRKGHGCWEWLGSGDKNGYGSISIGPRDSNIRIQAHRLSWEIDNGSSPGDLLVLHRCDNPSCVRPDHLFLGTAAENSADMVDKGRSASGEQCARSKLDEGSVREVKRLRRQGSTLQSIGDRFGVTKSNICGIVNGRTWRHVR